MRGKSVAILQSSYIPWKGYFDIIRRVDEFILFDDAQYTRHDWRNRNRIKTAQGTAWLTIPIRFDGRRPIAIREAEVADRRWSIKHWKTLQQSYSRAPHFEMIAEQVGGAYRRCADESRLSAINRVFIELICELLGITTKLSWSMDYELKGGKTERLVGICSQVGADRYLTGPAARDYLEEGLFANAGIELDYMEYDGYSRYPQLHGEFDHFVTALDLLFNVGRKDAPRYLDRSQASG